MEIPVKGKSMYPILKEGDLVKVLPKKIYIPGDILLFFNFYGNVWCHRFIFLSFKEGKVLFHLKGDNNPGREVVPSSNIIGKVVSIKRDGKYLKISPLKNFYFWWKGLWNILKGKRTS
ncbi:MAG: S24 family peptidase [Thermoanaerobaculia bacterium]